MYDLQQGETYLHPIIYRSSGFHAYKGTLNTKMIKLYSIKQQRKGRGVYYLRAFFTCQIWTQEKIIDRNNKVTLRNTKIASD